MVKSNVSEEMDSIAIPAFELGANEVTQPSQTSQDSKASRMFTEQEVEGARKQEKDKLYKKIEDADTRVKSMEEQLNVLSFERSEALKEASSRADKEAELIRQREVNELSAKELLLKQEIEFNNRINSVENEWKERLEVIEQQRLAQEALLDKERRIQELIAYKNSRMHDSSDSIIPELQDLVSGNSEEEIENSIAVLTERSSAIIESIQQATSQQQGRLRGAPVTAPPFGPAETQTEYQTLTAEDIRNMPMDQYMKMRDRLLNARSNRGRF